MRESWHWTSQVKLEEIRCRAESIENKAESGAGIFHRKWLIFEHDQAFHRALEEVISFQGSCERARAHLCENFERGYFPPPRADLSLDFDYWSRNNTGKIFTIIAAATDHKIENQHQQQQLVFADRRRRARSHKHITSSSKCDRSNSPTKSSKVEACAARENYSLPATTSTITWKIIIIFSLLLFRDFLPSIACTLY